MAKRNEIFPSKYLKAEDLDGKAVVALIELAPTETLGRGDDAEQKTVLYLRGLKALPLNMVNWDSVAAIAGDDTDDWPGHWIELHPTTTTLKGSVVPCIRIREPRQKEKEQQQPKAKKRVPLPDDMNDDIPF